MKSKGMTCIVTLLFCLVLLFASVETLAVEGTSFTYMMSADLTGYIAAPDAYLPAGTYLVDAGLSSPEDFFLHGRELYIADSGNHRIAVCSLDNGEVFFFGENELKKPTGICVAENGSVYVADYGAGAIVVFNEDFSWQKTILRPTAPYYGTGPYKPQKVETDSYGNLFVVSEGSHEGILQFDKHGSFNGFFGANKTKGLSLTEWFQKNFYTEEQKAKLSFRTPPNIVSLTVASNDMVYSVTQNDPVYGIKKLNMAGVSIWKGQQRGPTNFVDSVTTPDGRVYAVTLDGLIYEYAEDGGLLLYFGGKVTKTDRNGLIAVAGAIERDADGNLYILDKERGAVQVWYPTEYARLLHEAENDFSIGHYSDSFEKWSQIMIMNPMAYRPYYGCARALFQLAEYEKAAELYTHIRHQEGYSRSFWEIRSTWLKVHMEKLLIVGIMLAVLYSIVKAINKRLNFGELLRKRYKRVCARRPIIKNLTADVFFFIMHPIDGVWLCKTKQCGSVPAAIILYITALFVQLICSGLTSFVFGGGYSSYNNPFMVLLICLVPSVLFVIGSYLISAINDGEGDFRTIFVSFSYSLSVLIIGRPILTIISHSFTLTEGFIYRMLLLLIMSYTGIMIFISIKEAHVYNLRKTTANILLTFFFMIVAIVAMIILYILWRELFSFIGEVVEEVQYHVFT